MNFITRFKKDEGFRTLVFTSISGIALLLSIFDVFQGAVPFDLAWIAIILSGIPILKISLTGLFKRFDITAGVLVSMALVAAILIGEYFAAGEVAFIMMVGEVLENRTVRKAHEGLSKLISLVPQTARIMENDSEKEVAIENVKIGDRLIVRPGETIPVDGKIVKGSTSVDQSVITGESMPVDKIEGDDVYVGTINRYGAIEITATNIGEDSSLGKMIRLVKEAEEKKAPVVRLADRWATIIVPISLGLAILTYFGATYFPDFFSLIGSDHGKDGLSPIVRAVTILVVFCPCALVLATPTAIMAAIGNATKHGILIKSGEALEQMSKIDTFAFDKTGTVTIGKPKVSNIMVFDDSMTEAGLIEIAACAEKLSEHPLGKTIVEYAESLNISARVPDKFEMTLGKGVKAKIDDLEIFVGSRRFLEENDANLNEAQKDIIEKEEGTGRNVLIIAVNSKVVGCMSVADQMKANASASIVSLKQSGIDKVILLTGDNQTTANYIANQVGVDEVYASQLPSDKVDVIKNLMQNGKHVAMVGDGVNDAPALATASVGIAMGAMGTNIAIEAADVALMSDDISKLAGTMNIAHKTMKTIKINIIISMTINVVAVFLAAFGLMGPVVGALVHNAGSLLVVSNSARLINYNLERKNAE